MTLTLRTILMIVGIALIGIGVAIEQIVVSQINGWWADEFFALWASDPSIELLELLRARILTDSNPPLYFSLLHVVRLVITNDRAAVIVLNAAGLCAGLWLILARAGCVSHRTLALVAFAIFALGGPAAAYLPEARSYSLAMTASFVAVTLCAFAISDDSRESDWKIFSALGVTAALLHVFAALILCSLAAALFAVGLVSRRASVRLPAIAFAVSTCVTSLVWGWAWSRLGPGTLAQVSWIPFTASFVQTQGLDALSLIYGTIWLAPAFAAVVVVGMMCLTARALSMTFALGAALFVIIPIVISFRVPIILTRYWLVGTPLFLASFGFMIGRWRKTRAGNLLACGTGALIVAAIFLSYRAALEFVANKPIWEGASIVKPRLAGCGPGSIRVLGFTPGFAIAVGSPPDFFVDVRISPIGSPQYPHCAILGWSEHYVLRYGADYLSRASSAELLGLLKLNVDPETIVIQRSKSGFVVLRRGISD